MERCCFTGQVFAGSGEFSIRASTSLVLECVILEGNTADIAYYGNLFDPILADLILQSAAVQVHSVHGDFVPAPGGAPSNSWARSRAASLSRLW